MLLSPQTRVEVCLAHPPASFSTKERSRVICEEELLSLAADPNGEVPPSRRAGAHLTGELSDRGMPHDGSVQRLMVSASAAKDG